MVEYGIEDAEDSLNALKLSSEQSSPSKPTYTPTSWKRGRSDWEYSPTYTPTTWKRGRRDWDYTPTYSPTSWSKPRSELIKKLDELLDKVQEVQRCAKYA